MDEIGDKGIERESREAITQDDLIRRYKSIQYLAFSMNSIEDVPELLHMMLTQCAALTNAQYGAILVPDGDSGLLRVDVALGVSEAQSKALRFRIGAGVSGRVFSEGLPKLVGNVMLDPAYQAISEKARSELAVPMAYGGKVLGVVRLDSTRENAFSEGDLDLLLTIASHAAQLLLRTKLKTELEGQLKQKDFLLDIANTVDSLFDIKDVFDALMHKLADGFGIWRGMMVLYDSDNPEKLSVHSAYNLTDEEISRGIYKPGEGIIGRAVQSGKPVSVPDVENEKTFLNRMKIKRRKDVPTCFIAAPFKLDGLTVGVLAVEKGFESERQLKGEETMLALVASLIANKVRSVKRLAVERERLEAENQSLKRELKRQYSVDSFVCKNRKMLDILDLVTLVGPSSTSIMILGESGTGKEMIARAIHANSNRRDAPFVSINCAAIPENLLESELFGYKKGAFTGAVQDKKGKFQLADSGSLFLDEIGDMPMHLQVKLLRAIQDREVEPVGAERKEKVDIRILAATNRDLHKFIQEGKFREDLYYRLNVVEIRIPPLRERPDDIPFLVSHFVDKYSQEHGRKIDGVEPTTLRLMQSYAWPGNVRELENVVERAVLLCRSGQIEATHLPTFMAQGQEAVVEGQFISRWMSSYLKSNLKHGEVWDEIIGAVEKELIQQALLANSRNKLRTADYLGINRNTLRAKMELYRLD